MPGSERYRAKLCGVVGAAAGSLLVVAFVRCEAPAPSHRLPLPSSTAPGSVDVQKTSLTPGAYILARPPGTRTRYHFSYESSVETATGSTPTRTPVRVEGTLTERVYHTSLVGLTFAPLALKAEALPELQAAHVETETLVRRGPDGRTTSLHFAPQSSPMARNFLRGLLSPLEIVLIQDGRTEWEASGSDQTGAFVTHYRITSSSDSALLLERTKHYLHISAGGTPNLEIQTEGVTNIAIHPPTGLTSIVGHETIVITTQGVRIAASSATQLRRLDQLENDPDVLSRSKEALATADTLAAASYEPDPTPPPAAVAPGISIDEILAQWKKGEGDDSHAGARAYFLLRSLFEDSPDARTRAKELLSSGLFDANVLQKIADALGASTHGWKVLVELAQLDSLEPDRRLIAVRALAQTPQLTPETISCLATLAQTESSELGMTALQSLGFAAGRTERPSTRDAAANALLPLLGKSRTQDSQVLTALGNAASPASAPAILERINASDLETRIQAIVALRDLEGREVFDTLERLTSDSSDLIRTQTVMVLGMRRDAESRTLLQRVAQHDASEAIRIEALSALASRPDDQSRALLRRAVQEDASARVRTFAQEQLESLD